MGKGWICLHREILENWIFQDAASLKIWIAMLLRANHETKKTLFNGSLVTVDRGQFVFGRKKFSGELGVTESVLRRTLTRLKTDHMVNQQIFNKYSIISITNYEEYQNVNQETNQQKTSKPPANDQEAATSKQLNKLTSKQGLKDTSVSLSIFTHWQSVMGKQQSRFTANRKTKIKARLKNFTEDQIRSAINGCSRSKFHMGENDNKAKYNDIELICRNDENIEKFIEIDTNHAVIDNTLQDWINET